MSITTNLPFVPEQAFKFILAGNAYFTAESQKTGERFTFRVSKAERGEVWFVAVLTGPDNLQDYSYLGIIRQARDLPSSPGGHLAFEHGVKSKISCTAASFIRGQLGADSPAPRSTHPQLQRLP